MKSKICFILDNNPHFLGGTAVYVMNIIDYLKKNKKAVEICCIYPGKENKEELKKDIRYIEIKTSLSFPFKFFEYAKKVNHFLNTEKFDVINSHAMAGYFMSNFENKDHASLIHTYHGATYYFFKNHLQRPLGFEKIMAYPLMKLTEKIEHPPINYSDKLIYVSNKVKRQSNELYGAGRKEIVINSGVDTSNFYPRSKEKCRMKLNMNKSAAYGLYVGRGGWWTKGLDRAIELSKEIRKLEPNFKLIVIGPDYKKVKKLIDKNKDLLTYLQVIERDKIAKYYSACDFFLCCSRYEGGAPTLSTAEAMASGCLIVCSKDSEQEVISNNKNGLIIDFEKNNLKEEADRILKNLKNAKMIKGAMQKIKNISGNEFLNKYVRVLFEK